MYSASNNRIANAGFSLIEVLLAVAIMSFGLLALASLQLSIIRSSADTKAQAVAIELAKQKLEDLRNYRMLNEPTATCNAVNDSYQCITSSAAAETIDSDSSVTGTQAFAGVTFTRTWAVQRCTASAGSFTCTNTANTAAQGALPRNEFKTLLVTVAWQDSTATNRSIALNDSVGALSPQDSGLINRPNTTTAARPARARITDPGSEAGVIPIAVGNNTNAAATNPKPEVVVGTATVETRFDILTYAGLNGGTAEAQSRVETAMVGCTCEFITADAAARGYRPTYWNGFRYVPPVAVPASGDGSYVVPAQAANVTQSPRCDACCRDHHDPAAAVGPKFSPRISGHPHYNANTMTAVPVTTGQYKDACRIIRVDGIFRVAADVHMEHFGLLATSDLSSASTAATSPVPDTTATAGYKLFVTDYLGQRFVSQSNIATYNTPLLDTAVATLETARNINDPDKVYIARSADTRWLHSRALYVDHVEDEAVDAITAAKSSCPSSSGPGLADCVLRYLPFTSINLTEIADWNQSSSPAQLVVTTADYSTSRNSNDPVRGKVQPTAAAVNNTDVDVNTVTRKGNTSLLDLLFESISYADAQTRSDTQVFQIGGGQPPPPAGGGEFSVQWNSYSGTLASNFGTSYITGSQSSRACSVLSSGISNCIVTNPVLSGSTLVAGLGAADSMSIVVSNYNTAVDTTSSTALTCTGVGTPANVIGTLTSSGSYTVRSCRNYAVSAAVNVTAGNVAATSITPANEGTLAESTTIAFSMINPADQVRVDFTGPVTTTLTTTCTWSCDLKNNTTDQCKNNTTIITFAVPNCP